MAGMATSVWLTRHWQIDLPEMALTGWQLALGGTMLGPAAWLFDAPLPMLTFTQCVAYTYLSLAGVLIAYGLWFRGITRLHGVAVASQGLLRPVVSVLQNLTVLSQAMFYAGSSSCWPAYLWFKARQYARAN